MARVGLSRPKALHGLEIIGHGLEISKYDALGSAYVDTFDVRTSRSAYFQFVGHGHPRNTSIDATKVSQHMPRIDQGALVNFEALAIPMGLLERGGGVSRNMTQRTVSPESLRSLTWGENTEHENGVRLEANEFIDVTQTSAKSEIKTGLMSSSFQGNVSSAKSTIPNKFAAGLKANNVRRENFCDEKENLSLQPACNRHNSFSAQRQRNQSPFFRGRGVYKNPWSSTFHCHSDTAETFREVVTPVNSSFPARQSRKSPQPPRPLSSIILNSPNLTPRHCSTQRGAYSLPRQSASCHSTLFVVGHSNSPQVNALPVTTNRTADTLFQRSTDTESGVALGPRGVKFSSRSSHGRIVQRSERKIEALSGDCMNKGFTGRATNESCTNYLTDSGVVTNGYTTLKYSPPKSKPSATSPVKMPTSPSYSALGNSPLKPRNSDSPRDDQNGGRMTQRPGSQPHRSRTASRTSFEKSNGTCGRNLSEEKVMQTSKSDSIQTSSNGKQVLCDTSVNRVIDIPISLKLNGFSNPDENRNKASTASNTKVESCRNRMESSTVKIENSENELENVRASIGNSKTRMENFISPVEKSTATIPKSTATLENSDVSGTPLENSKVSFVNKVTISLSPTPEAPFKVTPRSPSHSTQLRSIQSPEPVLNVSIDISSDLTRNNSSHNNNEESTAERKNCNNHLSEAESHKSDSMTPTAEKDGRYFLNLVAQVESDMKMQCVELERFLEGVIPDEASGKIRAAIGKANLLITKKFKQFRELCNKNLTQSHEDQFQTTSGDLTGYWDMVQLQVDEIHRLFHDIHSLHSNNWIESEPQTVDVPLSPKVTDFRPKEQATQSAKKPKSSKASEASKAREESRKRLMAAKMAGRQRKASETEEEIQIFIS